MTTKSTNPTYATNTEAEYHESTSRLAKELLAKYTPEEIANIAAQHMIYVDLLLERADSQQKHLEATKDLTEMLTSKDRQIEALRDDSSKKVTIQEAGMLAWIALDAWRRRNAKMGQKAQITKDTNGKQKSKANVKDWWTRWQQDPDMYKSKAAFARAMLDKYPNLTNQATIENWCDKWKKAEPGEGTQASS